MEDAPLVFLQSHFLPDWGAQGQSGELSVLPVGDGSGSTHINTSMCLFKIDFSFSFVCAQTYLRFVDTFLKVLGAS